MQLKLLPIGLLLLAVTADLASIPMSEMKHEPKIVCYYESWAHWRMGNGQMEPSDINSKLCTHLVYSFLSINEITNELMLPDPELMMVQHQIDKLPRYKGSTKALLGVGGSTKYSREFNTMVQHNASRERFVQSAIHFMEEYGYDGILLQWFEMPSERMENFVALLETFHEAKFTERFTLAIALNYYDDEIYYSIGYQAYMRAIEKIVKLVDFIVVLTYDEGNWEILQVPNHQWQWNKVERYHQWGAPRSMLVPALALFVHTAMRPTKSIEYDCDFYDRSNCRPGPEGPRSRTSGFLTYPELCTMQRAHPEQYQLSRYQSLDGDMCVTRYESSIAFTYYYSYNDRHALGWKVRNFTASGYGGIAAHSIDTDDFRDECGLGKFPLLRAINDNYDRSALVEVTVTQSPFHPTQPQEHVPIPGSHCPRVGKFRDHTYCSQYYDCRVGEFGILEANIMSCGTHEAFDETLSACVERTKVEGCATGIHSSPNDEVSSTVASVPTPSQPIGRCPQVGKFRDNNRCGTYYDCQMAESGAIEATEHSCGYNEAFNDTLAICVQNSCGWNGAYIDEMLPTIANVVRPRCPREGKFRDNIYCFFHYECKIGDFGLLEATRMFCDYGRYSAYDETRDQCFIRSFVAGC